MNKWLNLTKNVVVTYASLQLMIGGISFARYSILDDGLETAKKEAKLCSTHLQDVLLPAFDLGAKLYIKLNDHKEELKTKESSVPGTPPPYQPNI